MSKAKIFYELVYPPAIWFEEVYKFYQQASEDQIKEFEDLVRDGDETQALNLVKKTLGII